ncbi:MAG: molybdopterin-guanine dinucleotide biosynthesis protein B [Anaerolineae bacterium]
MAVPVISFVGRSEAGKTTLLEKVIGELKRRGYRVATIKHHAHGFDIDRPGKDSWRHAQAGSDIVVLASPARIAMIARTPEEVTLERIVAALPFPVDIVLTEGFKREHAPKIEVLRGECQKGVSSPPSELLALATDRRLVDVDVPQYDLDDVAGLVDFLEQVLRAGGGRGPTSSSSPVAP